MNKFKEKGVLTFVIWLLSIVMIHAANNETAPRSVLFLGRFHPLILHLPIGAFILTFFLDIYGRIRKDYPKAMITLSLGFSAFFAVLTAIMGYFLSLEGGYENDILELHFWTGILTATLILFLFYLSFKNSEKSNKFIFPLFIISFITIGVTGHFGSILTHGNDFITKYAYAPEAERTIEVLDSLKIYEDVVVKILDDKCFQCHNNTKKKGDLSLLTKESILMGGENGKVITIGNAIESDLYLHALLPLSDEKHMPPEGKPQLSKDELWLLKYWIDNETSFDAYMASLPKNDTLNKLLKNYLVFNTVKIPEASAKAIVKVQEAGFSVRKQVPEKAALVVKYLKEDISKKTLQQLNGLSEQIVELNLSNTILSDEMTSILKKMKNLEILRLDNTQITDLALRNLENLENLKSLNLYQTNISNSGLENLLKSVKPEQIYIWQTKVDIAVSNKLEKAYQIKIHNGITEGFVELSNLKIPGIKPEKTLFTQEIDVVLVSQLPNVEIRYTLNGAEPDSLATLYSAPIVFKESAKLKAKAFKKGWLPSETLEKDYFKIGHKVASYTIETEPEKRYPGAHKLFDLEEGSSSFKDGKWTGYLGYDINTTVNLGQVKGVNNISINCLESPGDWILFPVKLIAFASDNEQTGFKKVGEFEIKRNVNSRETVIKRFTLNIPHTKAQFFKIIVQSPKVLPYWHEGAGKEAWVFVDEIFLW